MSRNNQDHPVSRAEWNEATAAITEAELRKVAYEFADACVAKAMLRLKEHPQRSRTPHRVFCKDFLRFRVLDEVAEWILAPDDKSEVEDIGNFAAWLWWRLNQE